MAFPTLGTPVTTESGANVTTATIALPSGLTVGNLLIAFVQTADTGVISGFPAGWVQQQEDTNGGQRVIYTKAVSGDEGASLSLTSSVNTKFNALVVEVGNWYGGEFGASFASSEVPYLSSVPFPRASPSLTPNWGAADTLWFSAYMADSTNTIVTSPVGYTFLGSSAAATTAGSAIHVFTRAANQATEQPSDWTMSSQRNGAIYTLAVRPAGGASLTKKLKATVHPSAAGSTNISGVVFEVDDPSIVGPEIGEFSDMEFESVTEGAGATERAVLKVPVSSFGGSSLVVGGAVALVAMSGTHTTGIISATVIEE